MSQRAAVASHSHSSNPLRVSVLLLALTVGYAGTASATSLSVGDVITYTQAAWGTGGEAATLLLNNYNSVYFSVSDLFAIGDPAQFVEEFENANALEAYLPQTGTAGVLTASLLDPTDSASGSFGGNVAALKLNVDFADAGFTLGTSGIPFGDLILENLSTLPNLNGLTVRQFLADANLCLGGGACIDSVTDLDGIANQLNGSFYRGLFVSDFAQNNLVAPTVAPVPEPASLVLVGTGLIATVSRFRHRRSTLPTATRD